MMTLNDLTVVITLIKKTYSCHQKPFIKCKEKRDEQLHVSIVVSIPACHAGDRGSIPRRGVLFFSIVDE